MTDKPLYTSDRNIARMLGHDVKWLHKNATTLEDQYGFPRIDPAIGLRHIPSVEEWARERNSRLPKARTERLPQNNHEENFNGF